MARDVTPLGERLQALPPHRREDQLVMVVLAELIDEQNGLLDRQNELLAAIRDGLRPDLAEAEAQARGDGPEEGGAHVRLREPEVPPPDDGGGAGDDQDGDQADSDGPVAASATGTPDASAGRPPARRKAAAKKTAAKKTPAAGSDRDSTEGEG